MNERSIGKKLSHATEDEKGEREDLEDKDKDESELRLQSKDHQMLVSQQVIKPFVPVAMILKLSSHQKQDPQGDKPTIQPNPEHQHQLDQLALRDDITKLRTKLINLEDDKLDFLHDEIDKFQNEMHLDMVQQMNDLHNELHIQACNILPGKVKGLHDRINLQIDQIDSWRIKANLQEKMFVELRDEIKNIRDEMWASLGKSEF